MALNIHFEARRRQMVLDRACKARNEMAFAKHSGAAPSVEDAIKPETIMCTDQGQFYQTRVIQGGNDVVFEKVIHDPNFMYRASKTHGLDSPLHVNEIYYIMYPGATLKVDPSTKKENEEKGGRWKRPQKIRQKTPEPRPCPKSLVGVRRDRVYKILHPHTDF